MLKEKGKQNKYTHRIPISLVVKLLEKRNKRAGASSGCQVQKKKMYS